MKAKARKLVIHTLKDEVFHAYLLIQTQDEAFYLDCRPSDGMILATLVGTPIYISPEVMNEAGRVLEIEQGEEGEKGALHLTHEGDGIRITAAEGEEQPEAQIGKEMFEAAMEPMNRLDILKAQLDRLIAEEAYEEAARVRDQISDLEED